MNITTPVTIEDHIFSILQKGTLPIVELIEIIKKERLGTTKQGVYLIVKKLKKQEVVVIHNKNISLSSVWLSTMEEFLTKAQYNTKKIISSGNSFLNLKEGEKLQYYFRNPILTDVFWSHTFLTLVELSSPQSPVLIYNPHEWFMLARMKNESDLFEKISTRGQKLNVLVGHNTILDKTVRNYFIGTNEYETLPKPLFEKENYYINVIADFIIEVWIDKKVSLEINTFYKNTHTFGDVEKEKLEKILMQKGRNKFSITHSKRKSDAIRGKFKKYFFM
jgi:hypothetical protein